MPLININQSSIIMKNIVQYYYCLYSKFIIVHLSLWLLVLLSIVQQQQFTTTQVYCDSNTGFYLANNHNIENQLNYQLTLDTNSAELLINETQMFDMILNYSLSSSHKDEERDESMESIQIKFNCDPADNGDDEIDWNSKESNCSILELIEGYDFLFQLQQKKKESEPELENKNISLTLHALVPGKQQLVAHARWFGSSRRIGQKNFTKGKNATSEEIE